jgi:hypothetical protein
MSDSCNSGCGDCNAISVMKMKIKQIIRKMSS